MSRARRDECIETTATSVCREDVAESVSSVTHQTQRVGKWHTVLQVMLYDPWSLHLPGLLALAYSPMLVLSVVRVRSGLACSNAASGSD